MSQDRPPSPPSPTDDAPDHVPSPTTTRDRDQQPAVPPSSYYFNGGVGQRDAAPSRASSGQVSEGYPSWLPRRPPPPAPASTIGTNTPAPFDHEYFARGDHNVDDDDEDIDIDAELRRLDAQYGPGATPSRSADDDDEAESPVAPNPLLIGGRKPTPRSVRIVNLESPKISEVRRDTSEGGAAAKQQHLKKPSYATSYAHWNNRAAARRQNRVSSGSTAVAHPPPSAAVAPTRGWTRANALPTMFNSVASSFYPQDAIIESRPRPRFNTRGLHLELLRSPSVWMRVYYRLWPFLVLAHVPIQTFFDFNTAYMLIQVSKFPLPTASPSSAKNWALGAAAYVAAWFTWIIVIFLVYEIIYSFARRWRVRRPLIFPLYTSAPGFTYAALTSYTTFCFLQHLRITAFLPISPELDSLPGSPTHSRSSSAASSVAHRRNASTGSDDGPPALNLHNRTDSQDSVGSANEADPALGPRPAKFPRSSKSNALTRKWRKAKAVWGRITWRDGLAETFNLYAQNMVNVVTLLPRAGLAVALLVAFAPGLSEGVSPGAFSTFRSERDATFFRKQDGMLTSYAEGILWANVAWTVWRAVVVWISWVGLWILSGHTCAGICGPRDKWEEEELNRLSASLARARRTPYPSTTEPKDPSTTIGLPTTTTTGNTTDKNTKGEVQQQQSAIGIKAGRRIIHKRFASSWSNGSNDSTGTGTTTDDDILPWEWRECTRARVQDAWEFCVVGDGGRLRWEASTQPPQPGHHHRFSSSHGGGGAPQLPTLDELSEKNRPKTPTRTAEEDDGTGLDEAGLQRVLAAVGFPSPGVPTPARRGALRSDLFESPSKAAGASGARTPSPSLAAAAAAGIVAGAAGAAAMLTTEQEGSDTDDDRDSRGKRKKKSTIAMPVLNLPYPSQAGGGAYPFTKPGSGFLSSKDDAGSLVPFPKGSPTTSSPPVGFGGGGGGGSKHTSKGNTPSASAGNISPRIPSSQHSSQGVGSAAGASAVRDGSNHEDPSSSSHAYSSEPSTTSQSQSRSNLSQRTDSNNSHSSNISNPHPHHGHGHHRAAPSLSGGSLSSLGQPIPPTSAAFVSRGMRPLTTSGGTTYTRTTSQGGVSHRHSSLGSVVTSSSSGNGGGSAGARGDLSHGSISVTSGGLGGTSGNAPLDSSSSAAPNMISPFGHKPMRSSISSAGTGGGVVGVGAGAGQTRFPFLSGPPPPGAGGIGPSTHFGIHGRRIAVQHTGGNSSSINTTTTSGGSAHGHGHGLGYGHAPHQPWMYGHRRGFSHASSGLGSDMGYAASGSGEGDLDYNYYADGSNSNRDLSLTEMRGRGMMFSEDETMEEEGSEYGLVLEGEEGSGVDEFGRTRNRDRVSSNESGAGSSMLGGVPEGEVVVGSGSVIPMPRRHPHAGGRGRIASSAGSSGSGSASGPASAAGTRSSGGSRSASSHGARIAFPTSDVENTTAELGMVTGYARGMGMEMLSIEASDSLARRERAGRVGAATLWYNEEENDDQEGAAHGHARERTVTAAQQDDDDRSVYDDDEENHHNTDRTKDNSADLQDIDEEALGEREDRVGLLASPSLHASMSSLHHSPGNTDQRRSRESLGASANTRSRHSSYVRSNRSSFASGAVPGSPMASGSPTIHPPASPTGSSGRRDSLFGAARERASSFGVRVRERAQSLMQSVVAAGAGAAAPVRERTSSEATSPRGHHQRLASGDSAFMPYVQAPALPQSPLGTTNFSLDEGVTVPAPASTVVSPPAMAERTASGESTGSSGTGGSGREFGHLQQRQPHSEDEFTSSSHSRSGSESVSNGENYTLGRPIPISNPSIPVLTETHDAAEIAEQPRTRTTSMAPSTASASTAAQEIFYSPQGGATPLQSGLTTPVPSTAQLLTVPSEQDIPWTQRLLEPPSRRPTRDQSLAPSGTSSGDLMLSSAAASFVTARADAQSMFTTTTGGSGGDSSEAATLSGSLDERRNSGFVGALLSGTVAGRGAGTGRGRARDSGMVERAGDGSGFAPGGGFGDGRIA